MAGLDWRPWCVHWDLYRSIFLAPLEVSGQPPIPQVGWSCSPKEQLDPSSGKKGDPGARDLHSYSPVHLTKEIPLNIPRQGATEVEVMWPWVVAGGLIFFLLRAAKAFRVKDLQRSGETGLSFMRQEHWQAGPFHLHSTLEISLDSLQFVLLIGVMKYKCLCWYIKIAALIFFSAVDLITIKLPKPSWGLFLFYCDTFSNSQFFPNCIFCWEKHVEEFEKDAGEVSEGPFQCIKILRRSGFTKTVLRKLHICKNLRRNYKYNTASNVLSHLLLLPLDFHLISDPWGFGGSLIFWHYLYSCFSACYLQYAYRNGWADVGKMYRCLKYAQNQSQL